MATSTDGADPVTVSAGAVSVSKAFSLDEFPVPTVLFDLESQADEPVELRLTDDVPESVAMDAVGFHPEYDADAWTAYRDRRVQYETTLDPGESVRTVYGVRVDDADPDAFAGEPRVELLGSDTGDSPDAMDEEDALDRAATQEVREALANGENAASAADVEAALNGGTRSTPDDGGGVSLDDDRGSRITLDGGGGGGGIDLDDSDGTRDPPSLDPTDEPTTDETESDDRSLAAALADEVRAGDVPEEDVEALRDALGVETAPTAAEVAAELEGDLGGESTVPTSVEVRLDRLQSTMADLSAYIDALETFLDEEGDGQQAIEGFRADVQRLEGEVESLEETVSGVEERLDEMATTVEEAREAAESVDPEVEESLDRLEDEVAAVDDRADEFEAEVERLDEFRERLTGALGAAE